MKTKIITISSAILLTAAAALHMGHEPKCLIKLGLVKKAPVAKPVKASSASVEKTHAVVAAK